MIQRFDIGDVYVDGNELKKHDTRFDGKEFIGYRLSNLPPWENRDKSGFPYEYIPNHPVDWEVTGSENFDAVSFTIETGAEINITAPEPFSDISLDDDLIIRWDIQEVNESFLYLLVHTTPGRPSFFVPGKVAGMHPDFDLVVLEMKILTDDPGEHAIPASTLKDKLNGKTFGHLSIHLYHIKAEIDIEEGHHIVRTSNVSENSFVNVVD